MTQAMTMQQDNEPAAATAADVPGSDSSATSNGKTQPRRERHHYRLHRDPRSSHQQILRAVLDLRKAPVLDVGSAQGMLGHQLRGSGLTIDGVELNPAWADESRPYYRQVFNCGVEAAALAPRSYRTVVCGDVLEHVPDPVAVLRRLREAATDDATFVISVPNVAHLAVRLMLLFGRFPKMQRGILDRTHLHFFTRDTAEAVLREAGLRVTRFSTTGVPLDELWPGGEGRVAFKALMRTQHLALKVLPRVFGYQWVMLAEPIR